MPGRHNWSSALVAICLLASASARSQDLEPRAFNNLPVGLTFIGLGLARSDGDLSPTPSSPLQDAELTIDLGVLALSHTFALAGNSSKIDLVAGRTCYEGSATFRGEFVEGRRCEYVDPRIKLTWNFYGAPALSMADFLKWQQGVVAGASILATVPVGTYDSDHLINAGANRWMLRPSLGMSWRRERWQFEVIGSVSLFEDNDDFYGGIRVEQDPLYAFSTHVIYNFNKGRWLSLDANWFTGGETTKDGTKGGDRQENSRFGATFSTPITTQLSLKLYASTGVATRIGNDFDTFGVGAVYRF
jgi:hypothetical protein